MQSLRNYMVNNHGVEIHIAYPIKLEQTHPPVFPHAGEKTSYLFPKSKDCLLINSDNESSTNV